MRVAFKYWFMLVVCGISFAGAEAQCPVRPDVGTVVQDPLSLQSKNGVLNAQLTMRHSVDTAGFTHYCFNYATSAGDVESPTLRLNPGDTLLLGLQNRIVSGGDLKAMPTMEHMPAASGPVCGDGGPMTIDSTNIHFHGLNIPPTCHQDDVITTLLQPGKPMFQFNIQIPQNEPPGLYWYHPHVHGFTEFQVNGGASGALIVEGMEKVRPEVAGLKERVFIVRQQYLVPWVPGPYELTLNYQVTRFPSGAPPIIKMNPGEKQFWRVANATIQDFMPLQVQVDGVAQPLEVIAMDGYPLHKPTIQKTILVPPAGRAEFIVQAPTTGQSAVFITNAYSTGPTGNPDLAQRLATIDFSGKSAQTPAAKTVPAAGMISKEFSPENIKFSGLSSAKPNTSRKLYFSEEFGGTNGPIQFYITVDGQKPQVFDPNEKPVITTKVGAVEDWTIENRALETHAFHIHQIHFLVTEVDGKPAPRQELRDTIEIPYWQGPGFPYPSVKLRMDFRDPTIAGTFLFHCHILLHEDLGMMHKIQVNP